MRNLVVALGVVTIGVLATLGLVLVVFMGTVSRINSAQSRITKAELTGCQIQNVTRALDNTSHRADYRYDSQQIGFTRGSLKSDYIALKKVGISTKLLKKALKQSEEELKSEEADVATKTWATLTNCRANGGALAIQVYLFSQKPPPASQLSVTNALKPDPVGSS